MTDPYVLQIGLCGLISGRIWVRLAGPVRYLAPLDMVALAKKMYKVLKMMTLMTVVRLNGHFCQKVKSYHCLLSIKNNLDG